MNKYFDNIKKIFEACLRRKKYDHIIPLGYNCEVAYRFYKHFRFIDSSLFAWVYINSFEHLMNLLKHPENIATGDFEYKDTMYLCLNCGIFFHGQSKPSDFNGDEEHDRELMNSDKEELRPRVQYLKEKFVKYANDGKRNLYIKKISKEEAENPDAHSQMLDLYNFLKSFCQNEFDLLLITEESFYEKFLYEDSHIFTRKVAQYSPDEAVTAPNFGDKTGWDIIYNEFLPKKMVWKKKKLKFEEV